MVMSEIEVTDDEAKKMLLEYGSVRNAIDFYKKAL